jgi:transcriptional regulator GlxA family with amidase domain
VVTAQFTLNALGNFVDALRLASDDGDRSRPLRCQWNLMSATQIPLRSSCGFQIAPTATLLDFDQLDYIAVIGGLLHRGRPIDETLRGYLLRAGKAGIPLVGICTGGFVLCRLGLMTGRKCCISWYHYHDFLEEFDAMVPVADELYVVDGDRITSSGGIGAALTAAHLVERHLDAGSAQKALRIMQIDRARSTATLQPAPPLTFSCDDERVTRALFLMEQNINSPIPIEEMATRLQMSRRQLERVFERQTGLAPRTVYMKLRLKHARWMLRSCKSLAVVAVETGFANSSRLSAALRRTYDTSSSEERALRRVPESEGCAKIERFARVGSGLPLTAQRRFGDVRTRRGRA